MNNCALCRKEKAMITIGCDTIACIKVCRNCIAAYQSHEGRGDGSVNIFKKFVSVHRRS